MNRHLVNILQLYHILFTRLNLQEWKALKALKALNTKTSLEQLLATGRKGLRVRAKRPQQCLGWGELGALVVRHITKFFLFFSAKTCLWSPKKRRDLARSQKNKTRSSGGRCLNCSMPLFGEMCSSWRCGFRFPGDFPGESHQAVSCFVGLFFMIFRWSNCFTKLESLMTWTNTSLLPGVCCHGSDSRWGPSRFPDGAARSLQCRCKKRGAFSWYDASKILNFKCVYWTIDFHWFPTLYQAHWFSWNVWLEKCIFEPTVASSDSQDSESEASQSEVPKPLMKNEWTMFFKTIWTNTWIIWSYGMRLDHFTVYVLIYHDVRVGFALICTFYALWGVQPLSVTSHKDFGTKWSSNSFHECWRMFRVFSRS